MSRAPERENLDDLYYGSNSHNFIQALRTFPIIYNYVSRNSEKQIIADLKNNRRAINPDLYKSYSENLRKAVGGVLDSDNYGDKFWEMQQEMQANVSRFAAYKAHQATQEILEYVDSDDYETKAKQIINRYNRYQVAEYNTTVARSRTALQWVEFTEDDLKNQMYPNLKWLPSSSADPREEHRLFYGLVLPKNDPFWNSNYPGNLWNCKCDWEETDEPAFTGEVAYVKPHNGLGGNPAKDKIIFTDDASYVKNAGKEIDRLVLGCVRNNHLEWAKNHLKGTSVKHPDVESEIKFSTRGIKEYLNQPFDDIYLKNELIRSMDKILEKAEFQGTSEYKGKRSLIFKTTVNNNHYFLIVRKYTNGLFFHSITDSDKVLLDIKRK